MSRVFAEGPAAAIASLTHNNLVPAGTKLQILNLGYLRVDESFLRAGSNMWTESAGKPATHAVRKLEMYSVLIDHPSAGLILWEVGPGQFDSYPETWGPVCDVFVPTDRNNMQALDVAVKNAGYSIDDVKHVIIGHLHLDHAGGLQYFKGRSDVKIWVHEIEFKHAFWAVGTGIDSAYQEFYLDLGLNWVTFNDPVVDLFPGITVHLSPGHAAGLLWLQVNLPQAGTIVFTSDHIHIRENYEYNQPQGCSVITQSGTDQRSGCASCSG